MRDMSRFWKAVGAVLLVIGILSFIGGIGMGDTQTATTCYQTEYSRGVSGCVATEVDTSGAQTGSIATGFVLSVFGIGLIIGAKRNERNTPVENRLMDKQCPRCDSLLLWTGQDEQPNKPKAICPNCKDTIWKKE